MTWDIVGKVSVTALLLGVAGILLYTVFSDSGRIPLEMPLRLC